MQQIRGAKPTYGRSPLHDRSWRYSGRDGRLRRSPNPRSFNALYLIVAITLERSRRRAIWCRQVKPSDFQRGRNGKAVTCNLQGGIADFRPAGVDSAAAGDRLPSCVDRVSSRKPPCPTTRRQNWSITRCFRASFCAILKQRRRKTWRRPLSFAKATSDNRFSLRLGR